MIKRDFEVMTRSSKLKTFQPRVENFQNYLHTSIIKNDRRRWIGKILQKLVILFIFIAHSNDVVKQTSEEVVSSKKISRFNISQFYIIMESSRKEKSTPHQLHSNLLPPL